ncbi:putative retrotransposon gag domain, aspartic peptidase domain protein, partial [Tanacetum coccineum]
MTIKTEKNGASGSVVVDENRGRDDARQHPKKRGTSKDVVASLDKRVAGVDTSMAELDFTSMREDFRVSLNTLSGDLMREICGVRDMFMDEITKIWTEFGEEISTIHQTFEDLQADVALCKRSLASGGDTTNHGPKLDVPKPSPFLGKREARAVDVFLWEIKQYLKGIDVVDDASKIKMATRYLKDTAHRYVGDIADLKKQFYPENAKNEAKSRLRKLKQSGTIREYVKEFTTLDMEGVQDLSMAIAHVEALIDFSTRMEPSKLKDQKVNQEKGGGEKNAQPKVYPAHRDCSKKASLNGMSAHEEENAGNGGSMGSIRILNAIKAKTEVPKVVGKGLQYVEATI